MKKLSLSVVFLLVLGTVSAAHNKVFCYYSSWATYRLGAGQFGIEKIDPNLCTHIAYSFVGLNADGSVKLLDAYNDITNTALTRFANLKQTNPNLKVMVAMGGWNEGSVTYSNVVNSAVLRNNLVQAIYSFIKSYDFDGFDFDWEYPAQRGGAATDKVALVDFLKELRAKFGTEYEISMAVGASSDYITTSYDVVGMNKYLDYINIMAYDYFGSWNTYTGHHSSLYTFSSDYTQTNNVDYSIKAWIAAGATSTKILLGVPFYGRSYTLSSVANNAYGASVSGSGNAGVYTQEPSLLAFLEICLALKNGGWTTVVTSNSGAPYSYNANQWVGYDNKHSLQRKAQYVMDNNLGGMMVWAIDYDDASNACGTGAYPLLNTVFSALNENSSGTATTATAATTTSTTTTTTTKSTAASTTTTAAPSTGVVCTKSGFMVDPADCSIYYTCVANGNTFTRYDSKCPSNLVFDIRYGICNYRSSVNC